MFPKTIGLTRKDLLWNNVFYYYVYINRLRK